MVVPSVRLLVMDRRSGGDRVLMIAGLALIISATAVLVLLFLLPPADRNNALPYLGFALTLIVAFATLWGWLRRTRHPIKPQAVKVLATRLAEAVYGQWRAAAEERRLMSPTPIPIRWSLSDSDIAGPVEAAVGSPDQQPAFPPLPGYTAVSEKQLVAGGKRRELCQLFAGLASGRIVVVGAPGAGKSGAAILLLLDVLAHRESLNDTKRARVPVPVLFTGHGWDPNTTSAQDWLRDQLVATYPLLQRRGGDADAAALVAASNKIALFLDGLDEMEETLRPAALQALSDVPFRVVVLTRSPEMIQATRHTWLVGAVALQLHDVTGPEAADYLQRSRTGPPPSDWPMLLTQLREHPDGLLARGLSTPLTITLLRDTYHTDDELDDLLDPTRYSTTEHIERYLITRILPAAYTPRPGRPPPPCSEAQARQALTFLAERMNQDHTRDLAWWHIPRWASTMPRIFTTTIKHGLKYGFGYGLLYGLVFGLALALLIAFLTGRITIEIVVVVTLVALISGAIYGPMVGAMLGSMGSFIGKLATWRLMRRFNKMIVEPRRIKITMNGHALASRQALGLGLIGVLSGELFIGLWHGPVSALVSGPVYGIATWLAYGLTESDTGEGRPLSPREIWRNDRSAGLLIGLLTGLGFGLIYGFSEGLIYALSFGLIFGLGTGLFAIPRSRPTTMAWRELRISGYVPSVKLMPFLEDARERGVLRTVGSVYQFRHAILQDQLADQTIPTSTDSQAS